MLKRFELKIKNYSKILAVSGLGIFSDWIFATGEATKTKPTMLEQFVPFILLGLIFYFLLIRPQQKKYKRQLDFLSKIKRGDEVLTSSGMFGRIEGLTEQFVILEVADDVRVRILKSQIASFVQDNTTTSVAHKGN